MFIFESLALIIWYRPGSEARHHSQASSAHIPIEASANKIFSCANWRLRFFFVRQRAVAANKAWIDSHAIYLPLPHKKPLSTLIEM